MNDSHFLHVEFRRTFWMRHVLHRMVRHLKGRGQFPVEPRLCAFPNDLIGRELAVAGSYEAAGIDAVRWLCDNGIVEKPEGSAFLDIGANIGIYTASLAHRFAEVVAFEPHPITSLLLELNTRINSLANVSVQPYALSDADGYAELADAGFDNVGASSLERGRASGMNHRVKLRQASVAVRDITNRRVSLIKLDVEGHELKVVMGLADLLREQHPIVAFEANSPEQADSLPEILRELGYVQFVALDYWPVVKSLALRVLLLTLLGVRHRLSSVTHLGGRQCSLVFAFDSAAAERWAAALS